MSRTDSRPLQRASTLYVYSRRRAPRVSSPGVLGDYQTFFLFFLYRTEHGSERGDNREGGD